MLDPGAAALAFIFQVLGLPANADELLHVSGKATLDGADMLRLSRRFPVKARLIASTLERLAATPLPALAQMRDGGWLVIGRFGDGKVLVQDPAAASPEVMSAEVFADRWSGKSVAHRPAAPALAIRTAASASPGSWTRSRSTASRSPKC